MLRAKRKTNDFYLEGKNMAKTQFKQLEEVLMDQIQKLNDDSIFEKEEEAKIIIDKSKAISDLVKNYTELQNTKINIVRTVENNGGLYEGYLGIE